MDLDTVRLGFGWFLFWIWIFLGFRWIGSGRFFLDLDLFGFFDRFGLVGFSFSTEFWFFLDLDLFGLQLDWIGFSLETDLSVFSRDWISNGIFKKLLL